jgi:alpha-tubulin suppressor-like RCC1 family protein
MPATPPPPTGVGANGGVVIGPDGSRVDVPPGAVPGEVVIAIAKNASLAPPLAEGGSFKPVSNVYEITPHGTAFAEPVTVTLPIDPTLATVQDGLVVLKAQPGGDWRVHSNAVRDGNLVSVKVRDFSVLLVAQPKVPVPPAGPFRFSIDVSGAAPNLTVTYRFSGARPVCTGGITVTTVFRYMIQDTYRVLTALGWRSSVSSGALADQTAFVVPGGIEEAAQGHRVVQPLLPPPANYSTPATSSETRWTPFVEGRVTCLNQALTPTIASSTSWTLVSENVPQLIPLVGPVALVKDIVPVQVAVGDRAQSFGTAEIRDASWRQSLAQNSRWELSRDSGQTWTPLANADQVSPEPGLLGGFRLSALLPQLPISYNGALVRLSACIEPSLRTSSPGEGPPCASGAPHPLAVTAATIPPAISLQPVSAVVVVGASATFSAAVTGTPTPSLQWQRLNAQGVWADIAGAQSSSYTVVSAGNADDGAQFRLIASNGAGSAASAPAVLNVVSQAAPPTIVSTSGDLTVPIGSSAVFAATVNGTAPLSFQWYRDGIALTGANAPILRLDQVSRVQAGSYTLQVSNPAGSVTSPAQRLTVADGGIIAPTIVTQPASATVNAGNTASFAVAAAGTGPITYQWRKNGAAIGGANGAVYTIAAVVMTDAGAFSVVVTNTAGSVTSSAATLTVNAAPGPTAPAITTQPSGLVVIPGATATFAVAATGTGPLNFQWRRNGADLTGATASVLTLTNVSGADAGTYSVVISNAAGNVTSANAPLILIGAPSITAQPQSVSVALGQPATFAVSATGDALRYQWLRNNAAISGATNPAHTTEPAQAADNGAVYSVIVYNNAGLAFSDGALLTVVAPVTPPVITAQPVDATVNDGEFATIVTEVGGSRPLAFQLQRLVGTTWTDAGTVLSTSSLLPVAAQTPALTAADSGVQFRVVFSNTAGNVATRAVTVTVNPAAPANAMKGIAITAGYRNSFVVAPDRTVWAWGEAVDATTGHYNVSGLWTQWALRPVQVAGLAGVVKVAVSSADGTASRAHYALHADGTVSAWGNNNYGQLGDKTVAIDRIAPVKVMDGALPIDKVCDIAAGNAILVAIRSDEADGSCGPGKARRAWIAGIFVGSVVGGLAVPSATHPYNGAIVRQVPGLPAGVPVARIRVPDTAFANAAVLFFLEDGRVFAWGWNYDNALGGGGALNIGIDSASGASAEVTSFWGNAEWAEIGRSFTISRHTDGTLRSVGRNAYGQLGDGVSSGASRTTLQNVVTPVTLATEPQALSVGHETVIAIERANGALWGWGDGYGLISSTPNEAVVAPRRIGTGTGFQAVSAGNRHALAIGPGNVIYAWGFRESGGLGDGEITGLMTTPTMVTR